MCLIMSTNSKTIKTKTKTSTKTIKKGIGKVRKTCLLKLCAEMNGMAIDAVDKEIIKRFKTSIATSEEDIPKLGLEIILNNPKDVDMSSFSENLQPYIKHYLFMLKRSKK